MTYWVYASFKMESGVHILSSTSNFLCHEHDILKTKPGSRLIRKCSCESFLYVNFPIFSSDKKIVSLINQLIIKLKKCQKTVSLKIHISN